MLTGTDTLVKPDRHILRFLSRAIGRPWVSRNQATALLQEAVELLRPEFPEITTRALDFAMWQSERARTPGTP